jgi:hypothetical protein
MKTPQQGVQESQTSNIANELPLRNQYGTSTTIISHIKLETNTHYENTTTGGAGIANKQYRK